MDIVAVIAENKIREAMEKGEFDNLPGKGKPLQLEDLSGVPEELRASYLILKNAGVLPPELELHREIMSLKKLIDFCYQEEERQDLTRKTKREDIEIQPADGKKGHECRRELLQGKDIPQTGEGVHSLKQSAAASRLEKTLKRTRPLSFFYGSGQYHLQPVFLLGVNQAVPYRFGSPGERLLIFRNKKG